MRLLNNNNLAKGIVCAAVLLAVGIFHITISYHVLKASRSAYIYDESARIEFGYRVFQALSDPGYSSFLNRVRNVFLLDDGQGHPHLFEVVEALSWKISSMIDKMDIDLMILTTNTVFLLGLLWGVYGVGGILYDRKTGVFAAILVSMFPFVFGHSRVAMLDYPLMSMVVLSLYLLLKTKGFSSVVYSMLFGVVAGLAELTKEAAIIFISIPLLYYVVFFIEGNRRRCIVNFIIAIVTFILTVSIVYLRPDNFDAYSLYIEKIRIPNHSEPLYYLKEFKDFIGPWILVTILPLSLSYFCNFTKRKAFLFCWFFIPLILFSLSTNKSLRFILPIAPAFALMIAGEVISNNWPKWLRHAGICILGIVTIVQYVAYNTGYFYRPGSAAVEDGRLSVTSDPYLVSVDRLIDLFKAEGISSDSQRNIIILFNIGSIKSSMRLRFVMASMPFNVECPLEIDDAMFSRPLFLAWKGYPEEILKGNYILDKIDRSSDGIKKKGNFLGEALKKGFVQYKDHFIKIAEVPVYDGSRIDVYKRIKD